MRADAGENAAHKHGIKMDRPRQRSIPVSVCPLRAEKESPTRQPPLTSRRALASH